MKFFNADLKGSHKNWPSEKFSANNHNSNAIIIHMTGQEKSPFNTGDCLTEVTTWTGLIVLTVSYTGT
jgi:hypothetical protein